MGLHFIGFTPNTMENLGERFLRSRRERQNAIGRMKQEVYDFLQQSGRRLAQVHLERSQREGENRLARRLFTSELRAGTHALLWRFKLCRKELAVARQRPECRTVSQAWRRVAASVAETPWEAPAIQAIATPAVDVTVESFAMHAAVLEFMGETLVLVGDDDQ